MLAILVAACLRHCLRVPKADLILVAGQRQERLARVQRQERHPRLLGEDGELRALVSLSQDLGPGGAA